MKFEGAQEINMRNVKSQGSPRGRCLKAVIVSDWKLRLTIFIEDKK